MDIIHYLYLQKNEKSLLFRKPFIITPDGVNYLKSTHELQMLFNTHNTPTFCDIFPDKSILLERTMDTQKIMNMFQLVSNYDMIYPNVNVFEIENKLLILLKNSLDDITYKLLFKDFLQFKTSDLDKLDKKNYVYTTEIDSFAVDDFVYRTPQVTLSAISWIGYSNNSPCIFCIDYRKPVDLQEKKELLKKLLEKLNKQ